MRRGNRFAWAMIVLGFASATALAQQGGNGGQGGTGGTGGTGGQGGGGQNGGGSGGGGQGGQGGMTSGTPLIELERAPIITAPGSTTTGGGAAGSGGVDASNVFSRTYGNPYYQGMPTNAKSQAAPGGFGSPLYGTTGGAGGAGARGAGALGGRGGLGARGLGGLGGRGLGGAGQDGVIVQQPISISFPAIATFPVTPMPATQIQADISGMIARTRAITNPAGVTATVENGIVTLKGTVKDKTEAKTIASMILLTPGVRGVKNDLTIAKQ